MSGGLLLCSSKRGRHPFIINGGEGEIWSLEELAYYLYQNACRITEDFFSGELIGYLEEELNQKELAARLSEGRKRNVGFAGLLMEVCYAANYYDAEELKELEERLSTFASLDRAERMKQLADSCMERKQYAQALREYERLLDYQKRENGEGLLTGKTLHNMGIAYGRNFLYREAEECLRQSLEYFSGLEEGEELEKTVRRELLLLFELSGNTEQYEEMAAGLTEKEREEIRKEWEKARSLVRLEEGKSGEIIEMWKQEYRRQMS